jgi:hypothetical protein
MVTARLFFRLGDEDVRLGLHVRVSPGAFCARPSVRVRLAFAGKPHPRFARRAGWDGF